jgi:hypothetical protein
MPSINRVKEWYAESFEVSREPAVVDAGHHKRPRFCAGAFRDLLLTLQELITFPKPKLPANIEEILRMPPAQYVSSRATS